MICLVKNYTMKHGRPHSLTGVSYNQLMVFIFSDWVQATTPEWENAFVVVSVWWYHSQLNNKATFWVFALKINHNQVKV